MGKTVRKGVGMGGVRNKKCFTQFHHGYSCVIVKTNDDGTDRKLERHSCSDRRHNEKKYLSRKRRHGYEKMAEKQINEELNDE